MCGIVGYIGKSQVQPILLDGLERLEYRGYDSAGIAVYDGTDIQVMKCKGKLKNLAEKLEGHGLAGCLGIGHTRWATHGAPSDNNSHPHISEDLKFAVVHNGIIENYLDIKEELIKSGFSFHTETDTETVTCLIDSFYRQGLSFVDAVFAAVKKLRGAYALGILCQDCPDTLIAVRKDCPCLLYTSFPAAS